MHAEDLQEDKSTWNVSSLPARHSKPTDRQRGPHRKKLTYQIRGRPDIEMWFKVQRLLCRPTLAFYGYSLGLYDETPNVTLRWLGGESNSRPFEYKAQNNPNPKQDDLRLLGSSSGQGAGGGARIHNRGITADLKADSLTTASPTPHM
ncbi:hypothetical protein PoB_005000500 [Plakobranchus ocellatus]|uniref:Uncharacterized protein n=1 Tax=Plakobranchus ocellatus TaxID=259542 RepID=A0AAV4BSS9_9GAST|nr:hypothetical protein PoB_005000500 [Plakobranchus ocellatus]